MGRDNYTIQSSAGNSSSRPAFELDGLFCNCLGQLDGPSMALIEQRNKSESIGSIMFQHFEPDGIMALAESMEEVTEHSIADKKLLLVELYV